MCVCVCENSNSNNNSQKFEGQFLSGFLEMKSQCFHWLHVNYILDFSFNFPLSTF